MACGAVCGGGERAVCVPVATVSSTTSLRDKQTDVFHSKSDFAVQHLVCIKYRQEKNKQRENLKPLNRSFHLDSFQHLLLSSYISIHQAIT